MRRLERPVFWLGVVTSIGMFIVLVMGDTVTTTGSAQGCGRSWPLCHGKFIPDFAFSTAIEFSHRAVTGVEGILVVALTVAVLALYRDHGPIRILAPLMLGFLVLQAGMGAWAVLYPQVALVLALHFGISLIALASTTLTTLYIRRPGAMLAAPAVPAGLRLMTWGSAVYLYLLVYSGAYIRHAGTAVACPSWPACGSGVPLGPEAIAIDLAHRMAAAVALLLAVGLLVGYRRAAAGRRDLVAGAWVLIATLAAEAGAGGFLVLSGWSLMGELLHAALTGLTFTAVASLCLLVTLGRRTSAEPTPAPARSLQSEGAP